MYFTERIFVELFKNIKMSKNPRIVIKSLIRFKQLIKDVFFYLFFLFT